MFLIRRSAILAERFLCNGNEVSYYIKNAGTQPKIPAHKKHTCVPLSPYVGIIQIRFWVKAAAYSQPACASTPFSNIILPAVSILTVVWYIFFSYPHHLRDDWLFSAIISLYTCITEMQVLFFLSAWLFYSSGKYIYHPHILIKRKFFILPAIFVTA